MDATSVEVSEAPVAYSLSATDFQTAPQEPLPYRQGDRVTRENFTSFVIGSFAVSRGLAVAQDTYLKWVQANSGLEYYPTIRNFISAGGWSVLSPQEQADIMTAIRRIDAHAKFRSFNEKMGSYVTEDLRVKSESEVEEIFMSQIEAPTQTAYRGRPVQIPELPGMSFAELQSRINEWIKTVPKNTDYPKGPPWQSD